MGWLSQSEFDRIKREALALTRQERAALTWETAGRFCPADTLCIAQFWGLRDGGFPPWEGVARVNGIPVDAPAADEAANPPPDPSSP